LRTATAFSGPPDTRTALTPATQRPCPKRFSRYLRKKILLYGSEGVSQGAASSRIMRKLNSTGLILLLLCTTLASALAQGTAFTYQGRLADNGAAANGTYEFRFALFDALSGGTQVGPPLTNSAVAVSSGFFAVSLDFGAGAFPGANRWLQIGVRTNGSGAAFTTLNPRQPLTSTPYAVTASDVTGANIARLNPPNTSVQATGNPVITSGFITSANVVNGGVGYLTPPLVTVNDTTGSGAIIVANVSGGSVVSFTVQNPGSGYSAGATITVAPPPSNAFQTFPGVNHFTNTGNIIAGNGSGLNNLNAASLSTGTVGDTRLSANVALLNRTQTFSGTNAFTKAANSFTGDGAGLTSLNASSLSSGIVSDARLSGNVARLNGVNQIFTGSISFTHVSNLFSGTFAGNASGVSNVPLSGIDSDGIISAKSLISTSALVVGAGPFSVIAVDINADGHRDLISANSVANTLSVLTNNGKGGFFLASSPATLNEAPDAVAAEDMNGDGRVDLISTDYIAGQAVSLSVFTNNGSSSFSFWVTAFGGAHAFSAFPLDVNEDGRVDLISVSSDDDTIIVATNRSNSSFSFQRTYAVGDNPRFVIPADVNGDGKMDLVSANTFGASLSVLTNNAGVFTLASTPAVGIGPVGLAAADFNSDGRLDLVSVNTFSDTLSVLLNNGGGGTFTPASSLPVGASPYSVGVIDFNGDGRPDLVSANAEDSTISILLNDGSGNFTLARTVPVGADPTSVAVGDLNGDGFPDLATANSDTNTLSVLFNQPARFIGSFVGHGGGLTGISRLDAPDGSPAPALSVDNNGNVGIGMTNPVSRLHVNGEARATVFTPTSDRRAKENFSSVSPQEVLARVIALPVAEWNFKAFPDARHIGPVAQDFHAAFSLNGADDTTIATVDADGVALAAIQGLNQKLEQELKRREAENAELQKRLTALELLIKSLPGKFSGDAR
jgi:hypothetical protein